MYIHFKYAEAYDIVETLKRVSRFFDEGPVYDTLCTLIYTFEIGMLQSHTFKWENLPENITPEQMEDIFDIAQLEYTLRKLKEVNDES